MEGEGFLVQVPFSKQVGKSKLEAEEMPGCWSTRAHLKISSSKKRSGRLSRAVSSLSVSLGLKAFISDSSNLLTDFLSVHRLPMQLVLLLATMTPATCAQCCASLHLPLKQAKYKRKSIDHNQFQV